VTLVPLGTASGTFAVVTAANVALALASASSVTFSVAVQAAS
jgi:hypothetical protein